MNKTYQTHEFLPVYDQESRVLILGSFPSVKSRETGFYYGHPKNRFWKLLAFLYDTKEPVSIEEKKEFLKEQKIIFSYEKLFFCSFLLSLMEEKC